MWERMDGTNLTVEEAKKQFPNQRILMVVTESDEHGKPLAGEVLYHSKRGSPWRHLSKIVGGRSPDDLRQGNRCFFVFAGEEPEIDPDKVLSNYIRLTNQLAREAPPV